MADIIRRDRGAVAFRLLPAMVGMAATRWSLESCFEAAKGEVRRATALGGALPISRPTPAMMRPAPMEF